MSTHDQEPSVDTETVIKKPGEPYVPWSGRVFAFVIDIAPVVVVFVIANLFARITEVTSRQVVGRNGGREIVAEVTHTSFWGTTFYILAFIAILAYWFWNKGFREGSIGKSLGKQVLGFTTVDERTRQPIGSKQGCLRVLLLYVDFFICYVGVLWPLWDVKKQTFLSDRFTNAIVLRD